MNKDLKIDKTSWKLVKFGDVVFEPRETMKDAVIENVQHVVGLEHIDTGDIHLRKSASIAESTTFTKKFSKGDVLFGRRRAYLKKAAQADFDGICSGDITVFRTNSNLLPELLPFVVNNDKFFDFAIKHSAGGLSPRVKFVDLANYEFLLPPKDQQAKLAELLWAMDEVIEKERNINEILDKIKDSELKETFKVSSSKKVAKLKDLCKILSGNTAPQEDKYFKNGNLPFVRMQHLNDLQEDKYPVKSDLINDNAIKDKKLKLIKAGSILLAKSGESIRSEKKAILKNDSYVVNHLAILQEYINEILNEYLFYFFQEFKLSTLINQTTTPSISLSDLGNIKVPLISIEEQKTIINKIQTIDNSIWKSRYQIKSSQSLQKSLINQVF